MKKEALSKGAEEAPISGTLGTESGRGVGSRRTVWLNLWGGREGVDFWGKGWGGERGRAGEGEGGGGGGLPGLAGGHVWGCRFGEVKAGSGSGASGRGAGRG